MSVLGVGKLSPFVRSVFCFSTVELTSLPVFIVVGSGELACGLLSRHPLLDGKPVLRVELVVLDPLQLKFDVDFLLEQNDAFVISAFLNGPTPASFCFFTVKL